MAALSLTLATSPDVRKAHAPSLLPSITDLPLSTCIASAGLVSATTDPIDEANEAAAGASFSPKIRAAHEPSAVDGSRAMRGHRRTCKSTGREAV
eukprot:CAMPEP_0119300202 /NCGR_PEP_ID=MMETSP1333-20130426/2194_1 /TAXON_ID=418940 /ORGANISM="Scyphosphaera apsteinii, Strain RCC1455" /LENGTH=94 /DNA_ID=CAMNT_0007301897 /DNA_START=210 /DNA_END=494 /DNA_ORIENTATION=+